MRLLQKAASPTIVVLAAVLQVACGGEGGGPGGEDPDSRGGLMDARVDALPSGDAQSDAGVIEDGSADEDVGDAVADATSNIEPDASGDAPEDAPSDAADDAPSDAAGDVLDDATNDAVDGDPTECEVDFIQIVPQSFDILPCESKNARAFGYCLDGTEVDLSSIATWSTNNSSAVTVDAQGTVTCLTGCANTTLHVSYGPTVAEATVVCLCTEPWVSVTPFVAKTTIGATVKFEAWTDDSCGKYDYTEHIGWFTSDPDIAVVVAPGVVRGVSTGTVEVTPDWWLLGGPATLTVLPEPTEIDIEPTSATMPQGASWDLKAWALCPGDPTPIDITDSAMWSSSGAAVAAADPPTGVVRAISPGTAEVTAALGAVTSASPVQVEVIEPTVTPAPGYATWLARVGGIASDEGSGIAAVADGSWLVGGSFANGARFGPGEASEVEFPSGAKGMFLARYEPDLTPMWVTTAEGVSLWNPAHISVLPDVSSYVAGQFGAEATFGAGEPFETTLTSPGMWNGFVARYSGDGTLVWARGVEGGTPGSVASLDDSSVVVTGVFSETATFHGGQSGDVSLTSQGLSDIFVARWLADGALAWAVRAGGGEYSGGNSIAALPDGVYVTGSFDGVATFGEGESNETSLNASQSTLFLARYGLDGTLGWVVSASGDSSSGFGAAHLSDGSVVVTGPFHGETVFGLSEANETTLVSAGDADVFVARYDVGGALVWARRAGAEGADYGTCLTVVAADAVVIAEVFSATATFGEGEPGETVLASQGDQAGFAARYESDGTLAWARGFVGSGRIYPEAISTNPGGAIGVAGQFTERASFDAFPRDSVVASDGYQDVFVVLLAP